MVKPTIKIPAGLVGKPGVEAMLNPVIQRMFHQAQHPRPRPRRSSRPRNNCASLLKRVAGDDQQRGVEEFRMKPIKELRAEVQEFMRACERLFGFTIENGRLTATECDVLHYYSQELQKQIGPACSQPQEDNSTPSSCSSA